MGGKSSKEKQEQRVKKTSYVNSHFEVDIDEEDRYFRVPLLGVSELDHKGGWMFTHFKGQLIYRQMELHPDKLPVLLVAGVDDRHRMCEMTLAETGLTNRRDAEILEDEFNFEWHKHESLMYP